MWPNLLRRAATDVIANKGTTPSADITPAGVMNFIEEGDRTRTLGSQSDTADGHARSDGDVLSNETRSLDGVWLNRSYVATQLLSATPLQHTLLAMLSQKDIATKSSVTNRNFARLYDLRLLLSIASDSDELLHSIRKAIDADKRAQTLVGGLLDNTDLTITTSPSEAARSRNDQTSVETSAIGQLFNRDTSAPVAMLLVFLLTAWFGRIVPGATGLRVVQHVMGSRGRGPQKIGP